MALDKKQQEDYYVKFSGKNHKRLIIAGHGLASSSTNLLNYAVCDYINKNNVEIDYIAMSFHNANDFLETTVATQAELLRQVICENKDLYDEIYLLGISYSSLACLYVANMKAVTKVAFVMPSLNVRAMWVNDKSKQFVCQGEVMYLNFDSSVPRAFSSVLKNDGIHYDDNLSKTMVEEVETPLLMIHASNDMHYKLIKDINFDNENLQTVVLEGANHDLFDLNTMDRVLDQIKRFFDFV